MLQNKPILLRQFFFVIYCNPSKHVDDRQNLSYLMTNHSKFYTCNSIRFGETIKSWECDKDLAPMGLRGAGFVSNFVELARSVRRA
jgi:hypothetical protein